MQSVESAYEKIAQASIKPRQVRIAICRLAHQGIESASVGDWLIETMLACSRDPRIERVDQCWLDEAPVYKARNVAVQFAQHREADYLVMIDADQAPDPEPDKGTFWQAAFDFAYNHDGPCVISAPTPMADGSVNVHRETLDQRGKHLRLLRAEECVERTGFERVPACGTGLILIDMRVFRLLTPPYFRFNYNAELTYITGGEDVIFTADCGGPRIPIYAAWDHWSDHLKRTRLSKPKCLKM